jgi:hypothetical protein
VPYDDLPLKALLTLNVSSMTREELTLHLQRLRRMRQNQSLRAAVRETPDDPTSPKLPKPDLNELFSD